MKKKPVFTIITTALFFGSSLQAAVDLSETGQKLHDALQWLKDNRQYIDDTVGLTASSAEKLATAHAHSMGAQFNQMGENLANFLGNPKTLDAMQTLGDVFGRNLESAGQAGGTLATGVGEGAGRAMEGYGKGLGAAAEKAGPVIGKAVGTVAKVAAL